MAPPTRGRWRPQELEGDQHSSQSIQKQHENQRDSAIAEWHVLGSGPAEVVVHSGVTYAAVVDALDVTEGTVKMTVRRMRQRHGKPLWPEIAQTVAGPGDVDDEIWSLFATLCWLLRESLLP